MRFRTIWSVTACATVVLARSDALPVEKAYGVNLGGWLLAEAWMFPKEWQRMGGEICDADCSSCAASEFALVQKIGQAKADQVFKAHWETWFTKADVDAIADAGLNMVRIPLGWWIVPGLVDRSTEFFPRGGMKYLKRGLRMLKEKGIYAILDLHALPGVSTPNQMFAGRCTSDVQFYTERNYNRALGWTATMTAISHIDPDFSHVFAIEAINEPIMDATKTPGYGEYQKNFVKIVRLTEFALGIICPDTDYSKIFPRPQVANSSIDAGLLQVAQHTDPTLAAALKLTAGSIKELSPELELSDTHLRRAIGLDLSSTQLRRDIFLESELHAAWAKEYKKGHGVGRGKIASDGRLMYGLEGESLVASLGRRTDDLGLPLPFGPRMEAYSDHHPRGRVSASLHKGVNRKCLSTMFQNKGWQYNNPPNPADAANGPQVYDAHLYFSFGGVADPNPDAYLRTICNTDRVKQATEDRNRPLVFGEWSIATNFNATREFLFDWADAQKFIYAGQAEGWLFWSFKIEAGSPNIPYWSYFESLKAGYFTKDPAKLNNPDVCKPYIGKS